MNDEVQSPQADSPPAEDPPTLSLSFRPHAGLLTQTRDFVSSFCSTFVRDQDTIFRIALAVHELLENAIKYSIDGKAQVHIELRTEEGAGRLSVRTENRATSEAIGALRDRIRRIHEAKDPFALYCDLVRESVEEQQGSGLGLARICVEAGLEIESNVTGNQVSICAEARIDQRNLL